MGLFFYENDKNIDKMRKNKYFFLTNSVNKFITRVRVRIHRVPVNYSQLRERNKENTQRGVQS